MLDKAISWLSKNWWGLIVAYGICLVIAFTGVWVLAEPFDILNKADTNVLYSRPVVFITLVLVVATHLTLLLELGLRRNRWKKIEAVHWENVLLGTWKGNYNHKEKRRYVTVIFEARNNQLVAEIITKTQEDEVKQTAVTQGLDQVSFSLSVEQITTSSNRSSKWRPEVWNCIMNYDDSRNPELNVKITDKDNIGNIRQVANPTLYKAK